ncbi:Hpt domain-containing protein [Robertkochia aurantiaca]|uniref:Hpt domain-containing protein n=1 Tax=Robertkochia aurantiaca TaxID=2873700 RepID=UPI001CC92BA7|nr:Hpt domain-containing protein [Robertkochia sp. 3YJGBD-33]
MNYDLSKLNELSGGDTDFNKSIIEVFLNETPEDEKALEEAINASNYEMIHKSAHKIKPNAELLGIEKAHKNLLDIELNAKNDKDMEFIRAKYAIVKEELAGAYPYFKSYMDS